MSKGKKLSKFNRAKLKAQKYYFQTWFGHERITPAFKQRVLITRSG